MSKKRYVPYGINGLYYIYDTRAHNIPLGYDYKTGTKEFIKKLCKTLNKHKV